MEYLKESHDLRMSFADIVLATKNFTTIIGRGGYGLVYKGELVTSGEHISVAVKRLGRKVSGQGFKEFLTEIHLLSRYKHPNLISLHGFCQEGDEKIIIYEYAEHGSLDKYLCMGKTTSPLPWKQRINICIDAARGLDYLHNHVAENHRIIHRDIKSANILLDKNWKAMISDLGLSKIGRANEEETFLITNPSGTHGYSDPAYIQTGILTKMSDIYSFGVVLFEVLCGRLSFMNVNDERRFLAPLAKEYYEKQNLSEIIDPNLKDQMKSLSLQTFSGIAYNCLHDDPEKRPSISLVVQKLLQALEIQNDSQQQPAMSYVVQTLEEALEFKDSVSCKRCESTCPIELFNKQAISDIKVGPWGGKGGSNWTFKPDGSITKILIASAGCVESITFFYKCQGQVEHHSRKYGGDGGNPQTIIFADDEEIIEISGTFGVYGQGKVIRSLNIHTTKYIHGLFGTNTGTTFSLPVPKGKFIGFNGNFGDYLNSLGAILHSN